jgi:hypothetical protein
MRWSLDGIVQFVGAGRIFVGTTLALLIAGGPCSPSHAAPIEKGVPKTPPDAAAVAGTYCCRDGNAYHVTLTLNTNSTYSAKGRSCLKNKGDASGAGTWKLTGRRIVLTPSQEAGWMKGEPKVFDVLKFKGDWILVRADWPDYYNEHGVTDVSCFQRQVPEERYTFLRDDQLPLMPPCKATVEGKEPCAAYLKTTDGRRLCVGGPGASPEVAGFVQFLQEGQVYVFPDTFLEYQKRHRGSPEPRLD